MLWFYYKKLAVLSMGRGYFLWSQKRFDAESVLLRERGDKLIISLCSVALIILLVFPAFYEASW